VTDELESRTFRGPTPYGWRRDEEGSAVPCRYEQAALKVIKRLAKAGLSAGRIAAHPDLAPWHPRGGPAWVSPSRRRGLGWSRSGVQKIVDRECRATEEKAPRRAAANPRRPA
jgi:hypothetical protein